MKILVITLFSIPFIYLVIAITLVLLPVSRKEPQQGLNFEALDLSSISEAELPIERFEARDGAQLAYRYIEGSESVVVILLHGSGSEGRYLTPLLRHLHQNAGATGIAIDLRGHGLSAQGKRGDIDYLGQFEDDLADLYKTLQRKYPKATFILGGHSSGGGLAIRYAGGSNPAFDGYLLLAPYLGFQAPTVRPNSGGWVQVAQRRYIGLSMLNGVGIKLFNDRQVLFFNRPDAFEDEWQVPSYSYRLNESFSPRDYANDLESIQEPVLALVGSDDEAFFVDQFKPTFSRHAPAAHLTIIADSQHLDLPGQSEAATVIADWLVGFGD